MNATNSTLGVCAYALILLAALAGTMDRAAAQSVAAAIPANATAKPFGSEWRCDRGFHQVDGACAVVTLPDHAYLTDSRYGAGWECEYGHIQNMDTCEPVVLPANAYLHTVSGDSWHCDRGYREIDQTCVAVIVPAHGYLTGTQMTSVGRDIGDTRQQKPPALPSRFRRTDTLRFRRETPAGNVIAAISKSMAGVTPSRHRRTDMCPVRSYGQGWECDRGYRKEQAACVAVELPSNAHVDFSGNDWECNQPYRKRQNVCASEDSL